MSEYERTDNQLADIRRDRAALVNLFVAHGISFVTLPVGDWGPKKRAKLDVVDLATMRIPEWAGHRRKFCTLGDLAAAAVWFRDLAVAQRALIPTELGESNA